MNPALLLGWLLQTGICAPLDFQAPGGATLRVIVCPVMKPAEVPEPDVPQTLPDTPPMIERHT